MMQVFFFYSHWHLYRAMGCCSIAHKHRSCSHSEVMALSQQGTRSQGLNLDLRWEILYQCNKSMHKHDYKRSRWTFALCIMQPHFWACIDLDSYQLTQQFCFIGRFKTQEFARTIFELYIHCISCKPASHSTTIASLKTVPSMAVTSP